MYDVILEYERDLERVKTERDELRKELQMQRNMRERIVERLQQQIEDYFPLTIEVEHVSHQGTVTLDLRAAQGSVTGTPVQLSEGQTVKFDHDFGIQF